MKRGQQTNRKMVHKMRWVVSPYRKDRRTGVVDPPAKADRYFKMLWKEIEQQFK